MKTMLIAVALTLAAISSAVAQGPTGGSHDQMLRQLIHDAALGRIAYQALAPALVEAVQPQAAVAQSELSALGALKSVTLQSIDKAGMEYYRTTFENGVLEWAFHVDDKGLIDNANYRPAKSDAL